MKKLKMISLLLFLWLPVSVWALEYPTMHYDKAILYDLTDDKVLYELKDTEKAHVASLTKILTTITAIESIDNLDDMITYTENMKSLVRWDASVAGLSVGDKISYRDLLYASILPSGADATTALAISTSGSISNFVKKMNEEASKIGMTNSHFVNVTGLDDDDHYSTAEDILKLLKYAMQNETFKKVYTTKEYTPSNGLKVSSTLNVYNKNNKMDLTRILGSKTGFTLEAGLCISTYFISNNHELLLVTLKAPRTSDSYNVLDALNLINFIDNNYNNQVLYKKDDVITTLKVSKSTINEYEVKPLNDVLAYLPNDYDKSSVKAVYQGSEKLSYKDKLGSKIGVINYYYQDNLIYSEDVLVSSKIKLSIFKVFVIPILVIVALLFLLRVYHVSKRKKRRRKKKLNLH